MIGKYNIEKFKVWLWTLLSAFVMPFSYAQTMYAPHKMSSSLQKLVCLGAMCSGEVSPSAREADNRKVCAFVKLSSGAGETALADNGCVVIARIGDIFIADVPVAQLVSMVSDRRIARVEAERSNELHLDSAAYFANMPQVRAACQLPKPFTGRGVVVGLMDVGFDLTHPTFFDSTGNHSRISRFWDQLSVDTIGSGMYVGAEYTTEHDILSYAHSRDALIKWHGTHTLGIAAGNGAGTQYVGMAPESDICLVSNAVTGDEELIGDENLYKYTTATDVLGFKYIFDYAESQGKPCVVSFSEGSRQDLRGDDALYYEALEGLVGEGRILVASAGNEGDTRNYVYKPASRHSAGTFVFSDRYALATVKGHGDFTMRTTIYDMYGFESVSKHVTADGTTAVICVNTSQLTAAPDSMLSDTLIIGSDIYIQTLQAYPSCYNHDELAVDIRIDATQDIDGPHRVSLEMVGDNVATELFKQHGNLGRSSTNPDINDGDETHGIMSPGSAPCVICVGGMSCRPVFYNDRGEKQLLYWGESGMRGSYSSVGPTFDGRMKPDVMAIGANVISAMSSYYMEKNPDKTEWVVGRQIFGGREYGWSSDSGTSMSAPVVAGIIALWLQANPKLSPEDVRNILAETCHPCGDYGDDTPVYCGYGAIDAYAGLLKVLGMTGVEGLSCNNPKGMSIVMEHGKRLIVEFCESCRADWHIAVYATDGKRLLSAVQPAGNNRYEIDLSSLKRGVYAVQIDTGNKATTGSSLFRIE